MSDGTFEQRMTAALRALDVQLGAAAKASVKRTPEERDRDFRAYHLGAARKLIAELRRHRQWIADHSRANPVGPSLSCFYRDLAPERIARRMAQVAHHRRLAASVLRKAA